MTLVGQGVVQQLVREVGDLERRNGNLDLRDAFFHALAEVVSLSLSLSACLSVSVCLSVSLSLSLSLERGLAHAPAEMAACALALPRMFT